MPLTPIVEPETLLRRATRSLARRPQESVALTVEAAGNAAIRLLLVTSAWRPALRSDELVADAMRFLVGPARRDHRAKELGLAFATVLMLQTVRPKADRERIADAIKRLRAALVHLDAVRFRFRRAAHPPPRPRAKAA